MIHHIETPKRYGDTAYVRELDGVHDLIDVAHQRVNTGQDHMGNASITGDERFTGSRSLKVATKLAELGWPQGTERISAIADSIEIDPELLTSAIKVDTYFDVAGDEPDIDRFLQGEPENMINYDQTIATHGRVMDLIVNVSQHAGVDKSEIENRGAAILAATEKLRSSGYSIGVLILERTTPSGYGSESTMTYKVPVLEPGQSVNVDTLAFSIMHPSFLRRLMFSLNEAEDSDIRRQFGFHSGGGYGMPASVKDYKHDRPAYVIDKDDGLHHNPKSTVKFAEKIIKKCLSKMKVEE